MGSTIYDVLDELRAAATSESDKGTQFEKLVQAYLRTDPVFADQYDEVWMWGEWPGNQGKHDTGIDLVARHRSTGDLTAIQCKFFAPTTTVSKPMIDSFLSASGTNAFADRIIVSTTEKWNSNAEQALKDQTKPVRRIGLSELEHSRVDWGLLDPTKMVIELELQTKKKPRPHQATAIEKVTAGFGETDRGRLIMACGTGKTFTSLRLAEQNVGAGGTVLFLVPSISLLSQTVREWVAESEVPIRPLAVCSDAKSTKRSINDEDISAIDLALPATTNVDVLRARLDAAGKDTDAMTVVFSTYQSIDVVAQVQQGRDPFDLVVCDEAHRTTGTTLAGDDESAFVRVHNDDYLPATKRLYMTATPRIYDDNSRAKAGQANAVLASMDDEDLYGPEFHRLGFGEAVRADLLADYKVLVLTVDEEAVARTFQAQLSDDNHELDLDDAAKIVGCWNGLAKRGRTEHDFAADPGPMKRAVAFAGNIKASKRIEELFTDVTRYYVDQSNLEDKSGASPLSCTVRHVDGTFNALERNTRIDWLQDEPKPNHARILTNARCLSEGVDVPALDAVMFLSPRKSVVDIVQSVGRVMRKAPGKKFGYIILPVGVPSGMSPEEALRDNKKYAAVWEVLQALRAHDERFDAMVNRIDLTSKRDDKINVIGIGDGWNDDTTQGTLNLAFGDLDAWRDAIYSKIVAKVGTRRYWQDWAKSVADIATRQTTRINALLSDPNSEVAKEFDVFLSGLRGNLNEGISQTDAVDMLAQHLITRPVFNALFEGSRFLDHNPVAKAMERMLAALDEHNVDDENKTLEKFYESVRMRVQGVDTAEGRQRIIIELYDTFFATAFRKTVDKLGIVYTPVEIVDFILKSADDVMRQEFGQGLTDDGVHVLDGFTGTGTFMVRLLQSGLIKPEDLARKYANELHANEILLLAYYIAAVNIETTYYDVMTQVSAPGGGKRAARPGHEYVEFPGLILTDTFQSWEADDRQDLDVFPENNERLERLKKLPITVIVGNPPYSVGQDSANDDNANESYPGLDAAIRTTYAARSASKSVRMLYDSYVRAITWATLRVGDKGIIAFVTNGGFLDSNGADGMRKTLAEEFDAIHVYNLRGNARTAGEQRKKEGGTVFDAGSRATVAVTVLVKNPTSDSVDGHATIHYTDIGDYLTREQKLAMLSDAGSVLGLLPQSVIIKPNEHGDWLNQRRDDFGVFAAISGDGGLFGLASRGLTTNRDAWVTNSGLGNLRESVELTVHTYNSDLGLRHSEATKDPRRISWSRRLISRFESGERLVLMETGFRTTTYRAFSKEHTYFDPQLNEDRRQLPRLFPTAETLNQGIYQVGAASEVPFSVLMVDTIPNLHVTGAGSGGSFFTRWQYQPVAQDGVLDLGGEGEVVDGYRRVDNITDEALRRYEAAYGGKVTKDDIFFYVYGLLHSPEYRETYAADLKKMLPRIPLVEDPWPFVEAGRKLSELHLGYESVTPYPLDGLDVEPDGFEDRKLAPRPADYDFFRVQKMAFPKVRDPETKKLVADKTRVVYNSHIELSGIPAAAYRYMLGSRSAVEWILDRYRVKTDKASGIVNDPNDWSREVEDPRYIIDLLARIVTVSLETTKIVDNLPALAIREDQNPL
ncbi:DEAD/DEAH box helicase [Nocardioides sp. JQ2195]|uniref:DEAD/DEAH box helicase n=1 Tax=Nocardioides sp. JQ2195 TaxID=2592334 RepID=UPI00143E0F76|nr:type ISP restriction/modification enzyme [Nocardioides sp. JQ2195]QIX27219.1 DEAD/DEAH box helicase [Nocardioides sp. JQ2195]